MAHALVMEGFDVLARDELDVAIERQGHEMRADLDPEYKRATWGRRPEDLAELQALTRDLTKDLSGPR